MTRRYGRYNSDFRRAISDGHTAAHQQEAAVTHQAATTQGMHVGGRRFAGSLAMQNAVGAQGMHSSHAGRRFAAVPTGECKRPNIWQLWGWPPQYICAPPRLAGQRPRPQAQSSTKRTRRRKRTRVRRRG